MSRGGVNFTIETKDINDFKNRIIENLHNVDINFEVGYCYKKLNELSLPEDHDLFNYFTACYNFLKGLAKKYGVKCYR